MTDMEYALEWYKYGLEKNDDSIVKFMMHWIAFNWLYSEFQTGDEKANIKAFCKQNYEKLSRYDAFGTGAFFVFKDRPVKSMEKGRVDEKTGLYRRMLRASGEERIECLLLTIYQVRCNLFHGSKSLRNSRDLELVRSSAIILEGYLKAYLLD